MTGDVLMYAFIGTVTLLVVPLLILIYYLFSKGDDIDERAVQRMRQLLLYVTTAKVFFMFAEISVIITALQGNQFWGYWAFVILIGACTILCIANWWALFEVKRLIRGLV